LGRELEVVLLGRGEESIQAGVGVGVGVGVVQPLLPAPRHAIARARVRFSPLKSWTGVVAL